MQDRTSCLLCWTCDVHPVTGLQGCLPLVFADILRSQSLSRLCPGKLAAFLPPFSPSLLFFLRFPSSSSSCSVFSSSFFHEECKSFGDALQKEQLPSWRQKNHLFYKTIYDSGFLSYNLVQRHWFLKQVITTKIHTNVPSNTGTKQNHKYEVLLERKHNQFNLSQLGFHCYDKRP